MFNKLAILWYTGLVRNWVLLIDDVPAKWRHAVARRICGTKTKLKDKPSYTIDAIYLRDGGGKGADIWGTDWPVPVAEKLEWTLCTTSLNYTDKNHKQYLITKLTDYIFFFIPFSYDEYIFEVPNGTYRLEDITNKQVVEAIALCEKWNWHTDTLYNDTETYNAFGVVHMNDPRRIFKLGDGDYQFIRTK